MDEPIQRNVAHLQRGPLIPHRRRDPAVLASLAPTLLLLVSANPQAGEERVHPLAVFPQERVETRAWMKRYEWKSKRNSPRRFELGNGRMHLVSRDDSVLIGTEQGLPLDPHLWPRLRFRLRVDRVPTGTDLTRKSGDDAAFRLYVAFDRGGGLFSPPDTIAYTWTEDLAPGTLVQSPHYKRLRYLCIGKGITGTEGTAGTDGWVTVERNLLADYRRVFGGKAGEVPDLVGFMLKCDSNDSGTSASAWLADLELVAPGHL